MCGPRQLFCFWRGAEMPKGGTPLSYRAHRPTTRTPENPTSPFCRSPLPFTTSSSLAVTGSLNWTLGSQARPQQYILRTAPGIIPSQCDPQHGTVPSPPMAVLLQTPSAAPGSTAWTGSGPRPATGARVPSYRERRRPHAISFTPRFPGYETQCEEWG